MPRFIAPPNYTVAILELQGDKRFGICREDFLAFIDRSQRTVEPPKPDLIGGRPPKAPGWNGPVSDSTRKLVKYLFKLFKVSFSEKFLNLRGKFMDTQGFVRFCRRDLKKALNLCDSAITQALHRLETCGVIDRKLFYDPVIKKRESWVRLNVDGIYRVLDGLVSFRLSRYKPVPAVFLETVEVIATDGGPVQPVIVEAIPTPEKATSPGSKNSQAARPFSSSGPMPDLRQSFPSYGPPSLPPSPPANLPTGSMAVNPPADGCEGDGLNGCASVRQADDRDRTEGKAGPDGCAAAASFPKSQSGAQAARQPRILQHQQDFPDLMADLAPAVGQPQPVHRAPVILQHQQDFPDLEADLKPGLLAKLKGWFPRIIPHRSELSELPA